ncbi:hypothetical protein EYZ11_011943 [Aspergillus tanneri]|uniref:Uncharacterized protein n=1 Tax=Aspergillus tanneri TaxID=1220188 RepID=A0A4S3J1H8_9EURO|nr:hypothetical protein EYZ11_011943 [Aspergillus tanneri]
MSGFRGVEPIGEGVIMGHEVTGKVIETDDVVKTVKKDDMIVTAFATSW